MREAGMSHAAGAAPVQTQPAAVEAHDLTLVHGHRVAFAGGSFTLPAGRVTALIGPNGAGKSTLLDAMAGLLAPARGELRVLGRPAPARRADVAYVLQSTKVSEQLPVSVREVVTMGRYAGRGLLRRLGRADRARVDDALERLAIPHLADRQLGELSGGERQRAFVAQGLAQDAALLLLDEPVTGLDLVSRQAILDAVAAERDAGRTVVLTTHDLGEASLGNHLLLLAGRVVAAGEPASVLTARHLEEAYGGRLLHLEGGSLVLDDAPHHHHGHADAEGAER